jgi:hypothetical protein
MHPSMLYKLGIKEELIISIKFDYFSIINEI